MKKLLATISILFLFSCSKLEFEDKCKDKGGEMGDPKLKDQFTGLPLGQKKDICYCNGANFNPYTNKDCVPPGA